MDKRISVHIATRDRHSELGLCLQSLRTQSVQEWDIVLIDESKTPITSCYFLNAIINSIKLEGHRVRLVRNEKSQGVCYARNELIKNDTFDNPLTCRIDDDVVLKPDYLKRLLEVIDSGYDMASGIIPLLGQPGIARETRFVKPVINEHKFDAEGNITQQNDDCSFIYVTNEIIPTHQYRTNCLYRSEINKKISYPKTLSFVGFREEGFHSFGAILAGYRIAVHTGAVAYHLQCPSGGVRYDVLKYKENVELDNSTFLKWCKEQYRKRGNFLAEYDEKSRKKTSNIG